MTQDRRSRRAVVGLEIALIFALFFLYGAYPVPDVNEQYYVGKAIHFWNPSWFPSDEFLNTPDSHWLFCAVFGLFSKILPLTALVWFGRILVWFGAAFGWQRLSWALVPRRFASVASAAAFLFLLENFHLAGEWVAGGVEGKGFAFPFVFLGLAAFVRRRYHRAFVLLGVASAFHVLVGGWAVLAVLLSSVSAFLSSENRRIAPRTFLAGLCLGGLIALFGLIPALRLDAGVSTETLREAHRVYVFERLGHHLVASSLPWTFLLRFGLLAALWVFFCRRPPDDSLKIAWRLWNGFVFASLAVAAVGLCVDFGSLAAERFGRLPDRLWAADFLRFYFFRLSDWAVPAGVALGSVAALVARRSQKEPIFGAASFALGTLAAAALFAAYKLGLRAVAEQVAASQTVSPAWPVAPQSTDAAAFLAVVLTLGAFGFFRWTRPNLFVCLLIFAASVFGGASMLHTKTEPLVPRSAPPKESIARGWLDVCRWARNSTPESAVFLVPRGCDSFKWNAHRADAGNWKEVPQDARSLIEWYRKMEDFYTPLSDRSKNRWNQPLCAILINKGRSRFEKLAEKYRFGYIVSELPPYQIASYPKAMERYNEFTATEVYRNAQFIVVKIGPKTDEK